MKVLISILFWAGIVFLVDGSLGLLLEEKWQKMVRGLNIRRMALAEIGLAIALLAVHFLLVSGQNGG
jgi:hypothetical protein